MQNQIFSIVPYLSLHPYFPHRIWDIVNLINVTEQIELTICTNFSKYKICSPDYLNSPSQVSH